jgi:hypothetical protein
MTATPVGTYLGPILKEMPQHLGTWCQDMGKIFTQFLSGHTVQNIVASEWLRTLGKASFVAAVVYPTYWYLKEPLAEYRKKAFETLDSALTSAAKYPIRTVLISWAAFYALFRWHGFEGKAFEAVIDPAHTKIFFPLVPALSIPSLVDAMKNFLDGYKNKTPVPALPPAQPPSTAQSQRPNPLPLATQTPPASIQPQQAQAPIDPNLQTPPAQLPLSTLTRPKYLHSRAAQPLSKTPPEPNPPQRKTAKMIDGKIHWIDPTIEDKSGKKKEKVAPIAFTSDDEPSRFILF